MISPRAQRFFKINLQRRFRRPVSSLERPCKEINQEADDNDNDDLHKHHSESKMHHRPPVVQKSFVTIEEHARRGSAGMRAVLKKFLPVRFEGQ